MNTLSEPIQTMIKLSECSDMFKSYIMKHELCNEGLDDETKQALQIVRKYLIDKIEIEKRLDEL